MAKKKAASKNLPCIGIWNRMNLKTEFQSSLPLAGATHVGLWLENGGTIGFFCAFYRDADGNAVDPDEEDWEYITFHSRQATTWDQEINAPDYFAQCRFLIPTTEFGNG